MIAEIGVNHDGDAAQAERLVRAAAEAGADAVKFQLFHPRRLLSNQALLAGYQRKKADSPFALLEKLTLSRGDLADVRRAATAAGVGFIVTPFSLEDITDLATLDVDAVKIASPDAVNTPLLHAAAELGRPMIISTGTCELEELDEAASLVSAHRAGGALLHCVSAYPTPMAEAALGGIAALRDHFGVAAGYSDHTPSLHTGALAVAVGASVLEKHLTHSVSAQGPDHAASLEPADLARYIAHVREAELAVGRRVKRVSELEADVRTVSRQSLCVAHALPAGHVLTRCDLTIKRPGTGVPAREFEATLGRTLRTPKHANDLLQPEDLA